MGYNETFRERLLQDEALQRSLYHQHDVIINVSTFMTTLRSLTQTERRKQKQDSYEMVEKHRTVPPDDGVSIYLSSSASQSFILYFFRSRGRWRSTGHSSSVHGVSVHQSPSAHPPAAHCTAGWTPHCHRWCHVPQVLLPRSAH